MAPRYLQKVLQWHQAPRTLHSSSLSQLQVPRTRLKYYGDRQKFCEGSTITMALKLREMSDLAEFKKAPKTHLLNAAFN